MPEPGYQARLSAAPAAPVWPSGFARVAACMLIVVLCFGIALVTPIGHAAPTRPAPQAAQQIAMAHDDHPPKSSAHTGRDSSHKHADHDHRQPPSILPQQAADQAQTRFGGRVLNVMLEHGDDGPYYQVKLLKHGRVRVVRIDAQH